LATGDFTGLEQAIASMNISQLDQGHQGVLRFGAETH